MIGVQLIRRSLGKLLDRVRKLRLLGSPVVRSIDLIKMCRGKRALGRTLSVSVLNQMVSSGTNFVLGVYLVRMLSPADFGLYGIGFAISLFYGGVGNALFLIQMVVHAPSKASGDRAAYAGRILVLVLCFCGITVLVCGLVLALSVIVLGSSAGLALLGGAVLAASIAYLLKDFFVRHSYNVGRERWALAIHSVIALAVAGLLLTQHRSMNQFNAAIALWIYAGAQACGALLGYVISGLSVRHRLADLCDDLREAFVGGKWASITNIVYFMRTQAHTIVVASLLGTVGVAKLNAARLLVAPAVMITPALSQVAMPRLAAVRERNDLQLIRSGRVFTFVLLSLAMLYCGLLLTGYGLVVDTIWGDKYQQLFSITVLWCLYTCLLAFRNGLEMVGQVLKEFKRLSQANTWSAIASVVMTYWLTVSYGLPGALAGLAIGEMVLIAMLHSVASPEASIKEASEVGTTGRFSA